MFRYLEFECINVDLELLQYILRYLKHRLWLWHCVPLKDLHVALVVLHNLLRLHLLPPHGLHHQISERAGILISKYQSLLKFKHTPGVKKGLHEGLNVLDKLFINLLDVPLEVRVGSHMTACRKDIFFSLPCAILEAGFETGICICTYRGPFVI